MADKNFNPPKGWSFKPFAGGTVDVKSIANEKIVNTGDSLVHEDIATHTPTGDTTSVVIDVVGIPTLGKELVVEGSWKIKCKIKDIVTLTNSAIYDFLILTGAAPADYAPSWLKEKFPDQPQDENGYTLLTPHVGATLRYIDPTLGDDLTGEVYAYDAFPDARKAVPAKPFATVERARVGRVAGDWLLYKKGETFTQTTSGTFINGLTDDSRSVITSYGVTGARPLIKVANTAKGITLNSTTVNVTINGLDFYAYQADPHSPDYLGASKMETRYGISNAMNFAENISIEDCIIREFDDNINLEATSSLVISDASAHHKNIRVRNNIILNAHNAKDGHAKGLWSHGCSILNENNYYDHNGWVMKETNNEEIPPEVLAVKLDSAVSEIFVKRIPSDAPSANELVIYANDGTKQYIPYSSKEGNKYNVSPTDTAVFVAHPADEGKGAKVNLTRGNKFNHNVYQTSARYQYITNNILCRPCSINLKFTSNPETTNIQAVTLKTPLSGMVTTVYFNESLYEYGTDSSGIVGITLASGLKITLDYTLLNSTDKTLKITSRDFSSDNALENAEVKIMRKNRTLKQALAGVAETIVKVSSVNLDGVPDTGSLTFILASGSYRSVPYTSVDRVSNEYIIDPTDFSMDNAPLDSYVYNDVLLNYPRSYEVYGTDNCFVGGEIVVSAGGNSDNGVGYRYRDYNFSGNVSQFTGTNNPSNRNLNYGYEFIDQINSSAIANMFIFGDLVAGGFSIALNSYIKNFTVKDTIIFDNTPSISSGVGINKEGNTIEDNIVNPPANYFVDSSRTILTYMVDVMSESGSIDRLTEIMKTRDMANPLPAYTAKEINKWIKAGFTEATPVAIRNDLSDGVAAGSGTYTVEADVFSPYTITWVWKLDGTIDATNTTSTYSGTGLSINHTLQFLATAKGVTVSSRVATLERAPLVAKFGSPDGYATITPVVLSGDFEFSLDMQNFNDSSQYILQRTGVTTQQLTRSRNSIGMKLGGSLLTLNTSSYPEINHLEKLTYTFKRVSGAITVTVLGNIIPEYNGLIDNNDFKFNVISARHDYSSPQLTNVSNLNIISEGYKYKISSGGLDDDTELAVDVNGDPVVDKIMTYHGSVVWS